MESSLVHVVTRVYARQGREQALAEALRAFGAATRAEPGCKRFDVLQSRLDEREFVLVGQWDGAASLARHDASRHAQDAVGKFTALATAAPTVRHYEALE